MILDATAGNRMMWKNKNPPGVVFLDIEDKLRIPPDIIADNRYAPFRDNTFQCIIYDPPHAAKGPNTGMFSDPQTNGSYYGLGITKRELLINLAHAPHEFKRLAPRLCFKWSYNPKMGRSRNISLWSVLIFFKGWKEIHRKKWNKKTTTTWWITFTRGETTPESPREG